MFLSHFASDVITVKEEKLDGRGALKIGDALRVAARPPACCKACTAGVCAVGIGIGVGRWIDTWYYCARPMLARPAANAPGRRGAGHGDMNLPKEPPGQLSHPGPRDRKILILRRYGPAEPVIAT